MATQTELTGGGFQDSEGNPLEFGYLKMHLSQDCLVSGVGNICSGIDTTINLDINGNAIAGQFVWSNLNMLPQNNFYRVTAYTAAGQKAWGPNNQQVASGSTFNLDSWQPNTVISWFPAVSQPTTFEINGSPSSASSTLNLEAGANITLTDEGSGTIQISANGGSGLDGNGAYFFGPGITAINTAYAGAAAGGINGGTFSSLSGVVQLYLFEIFQPFTLTKCTVEALGNSSGTMTFGIYSFAGVKLVDGGSFVNLTGSGVQVNSFSSVTLPPGTYWHAQATTVSNSGQFPAIQVNDLSTSAMLNNNTARAAVAANSLSAGSLPATLGTLTPFVPSPSNSDVIFCPLYE